MILSNLRIITTKKIIEQGSIVVKNGKIVEVNEALHPDGIDMRGHLCMPGFIDMHIHGCENNDVLDSKNALKEVSMSLVKHGVTSFLPTTLTLSMDVLEKKLSDMAEVASEVKGSKVVGIHLEGPFINKEYQGAQNPLYIQGANIKVFDLFNKAAKNLIKVVSYAPERTTIDFTTHCASKGIVTSVAHSNATFSDVEAHYNVGLKSLTHFHNAQSGHHHRKPGVVTAGFCFDLNAELICDGLHLDKDVVRTTFKIKGREHITLISDSTKAANMPDGYYDLGGLSVIKDSSSARLEDGSLAGSILNYNDGVRNFHQFTNCSLIDLVHVSSYNQAKLLGETELGDIKEGYKADLVIMNDDFEVMQTIIDGKVVLDNLK